MKCTFTKICKYFWLLGAIYNGVFVLMWMLEGILSYGSNLSPTEHDHIRLKILWYSFCGAVDWFAYKCCRDDPTKPNHHTEFADKLRS